MKQNSYFMSGKYKVGEDALPHFVHFTATSLKGNVAFPL